MIWIFLKGKNGISSLFETILLMGGALVIVLLFQSNYIFNELVSIVDNDVNKNYVDGKILNIDTLVQGNLYISNGGESSLFIDLLYIGGGKCLVSEDDEELKSGTNIIDVSGCLKENIDGLSQKVELFIGRDVISKVVYINH